MNATLWLLSMLIAYCALVILCIFALRLWTKIEALLDERQDIGECK